MGQFDITIASANPTPTFTTTSFRIEPDLLQQDITPASARRSDGDTRFATIPTESYWGQNDWSAGLGRNYPADPTSAYVLLSSVADNGRLTAPYGAQGMVTGLPGNVGTHVRQMCNHLGVLYANVYDGAAGADKLYKYAAGTWTSIYTHPQTPTCLTSFRGDLWVSYNTLFQTQKITPAGANTGMGFNSWISCPYGSMIFYCRYDAASDTWRLNRYDPENTTTVPDLAIFPLASSQSPAAMAVLGADLYVSFKDQLWRFTSANGNSGILQGPVDRWAPTGPSGVVGTRGPGRSLVAFQGALCWSTGATLRRYVPGGQGRTLWPIQGYDYEMGRNGSRVMAALCAVDDRLYVMGYYATTGTAISYELWLWTGAGMQRTASIPILATTGAIAQSVEACLAATGDGNLYWTTGDADNATLGNRAGYVTTRDAAAILYTNTDVEIYESALLDYGMLDIDKAVSRFGVVAQVPAGQDVALYVSADGVAYVQWVRAVVFPSGAPGIVYFVPPTGRVVVGKLFRVKLAFAMNSTGATTPQVFAINAIPNPVNPLRRGFRFTVLLDEAVQDHAGKLMYANSTAVGTAVSLLRQMRTETHPLLLTWVDSTTYYVRINTLTIHRVATHAGGQPAFRVILDVQEIT